MSGHTKISPQLALKMTYRHTNAGPLQEQFCHFCGLLVFLIGVQALYFHAMPTANHSDIYHCGHTTAMCPAVSESSLNIP